MSNAQRPQALTSAETQALIRLAWIIDRFRELNSKMPSSYIAAFLAVAIKPGFGPSQYAKDLGTIQPIASRLLLEIGPKAREREGPGMGLVTRKISPENGREVEYTLTPEGARLARQIGRMLSPGPKRVV